MVVYFWSRPNYGSNEHPIVIYLPNAECDFKEVLDCIILAFHHNEILELIDIMRKFLDYEAGSFEKFEDSNAYQVFVQDANQKLIDKKRLLKALFDIIRDGINDTIEVNKVIKKLLKWAKDYAEDILEQF